MKTIEIFKTNVLSNTQASELKLLLKSFDTRLRINFDLEDCDKIMRIQGANISNNRIIELANSIGIKCEELPE